jgi:hypothetical protein
MTAGIGSIVVRQHLPEYAGSNSSAHIHVEAMARPSAAVAQATTPAAEFAPKCASTAAAVGSAAKERFLCLPIMSA